MEIKEIEVREKGITDISKNLEIKEKGMIIHLTNRIKNKVKCRRANNQILERIMHTGKIRQLVDGSIPEQPTKKTQGSEPLFFCS
jgi:hypothetical protein